jgi:glycine cleavage system H protein
MESFYRVDIFDTKGIEYLFVIGYLLFLIVFWNLARKPERITGQINKVMNRLSAGILKIPQGVFHSRFHTWTHLDESGVARVGMDDFLQHITGDVTFTGLKQPDEIINKGELMTQIDQDGKCLKVYSPISGKILASNTSLNENPEIFKEDPYKKAWIYEIKPVDWTNETNSYLLAEDATNWAARELTRFKDFLTGGAMGEHAADPSMVLLQDGGEIREKILSELPGEVWMNFQEQFLSASL